MSTDSRWPAASCRNGDGLQAGVASGARPQLGENSCATERSALGFEKKDQEGSVMTKYDYKPKVLCEHHFCRCMRAEELCQMGLLEAALQAHQQKVRCRLVDD